jgi:hypothetical protein
MPQTTLIPMTLSTIRFPLFLLTSILAISLFSLGQEEATTTNLDDGAPSAESPVPAKNDDRSEDAFLRMEKRSFWGQAKNGLQPETVEYAVFQSSDKSLFACPMPIVFEDENGVLQAISDVKKVKKTHCNRSVEYFAELEKAEKALTSTSSDETTKAKAKERLSKHLQFMSDFELDRRDVALKELEDKVAKMRAQLEVSRKSQSELISMQTRMLEMISEGIHVPENLLPSFTATTAGSNLQLAPKSEGDSSAPHLRPAIGVESPGYAPFVTTVTPSYQIVSNTNAPYAGPTPVLAMPFPFQTTPGTPSTPANNYNNIQPGNYNNIQPSSVPPVLPMHSGFNPYPPPVQSPPVVPYAAALPPNTPPNPSQTVKLDETKTKKQK